MSPAAPFKAIFWDNDGVLVDTEPLYFRANRQVLARLGIALDREGFREHFLRRAQGAFHLATAAGLPESEIPALRAERNRIYAELLRTEALAVPGASEALAALRPRFAMGVVTSSRREHFELIHARTGFTRHFDFVVTSDDVSAAKPDPEPYRRALALCGRPPAECLAIEDSERGLAAARAAGIACWVIPNELTRGGDFRAADRVLASIAEVPRLLGPNAGYPPSPRPRKSYG